MDFTGLTKKQIEEKKASEYAKVDLKSFKHGDLDINIDSISADGNRVKVMIILKDKNSNVIDLGDKLPFYYINPPVMADKGKKKDGLIDFEEDIEVALKQIIVETLKYHKIV